MQAVQTKYLGPSNSHGSRIIAKCATKRIIVARDYSTNIEDDHRRVARKLILQMGWTGRWIQGCLPDETYAFVCEQRRDEGQRDGNHEGFDVWAGMDDA